MGLAKEANEEEAQYNNEREDPAAPSYSPDTLRKYPDILIESLPWHVHTDITPSSELTTEPAGKLLDQGPEMSESRSPLRKLPWPSDSELLLRRRKSRDTFTSG